MAGRIGKNFVVARAIDQGRQPADLQFSATFDEHVGLVQHANVARSGIDEVLVFRAAGNGGDFDFIAANLHGACAIIGDGGHDVEFGL